MGSFKSAPTYTPPASTVVKFETMSVVPSNDKIRCYQFAIPKDEVAKRSAFLS